MFVTFCVGSYLFTLGCFLMTVPIINEASSHSFVCCIARDPAAELQMFCPPKLRLESHSHLWRVPIESQSLQSRATLSAALCGSCKVATIVCPNQSIGITSAAPDIMHEDRCFKRASFHQLESAAAPLLGIAWPVMQCSEMHETSVKLCRWLGFKPSSVAYWGGVIYTCGAVL